MTQSRRQSPSEPETPGADRFWGQFSQTGRSRDEDPKPDPDADSGRAGARDDAADRENADGRPEPDGNDTHLAGHGECLDWCPICRSAELLRSAVTPELREQAESLQREAFSVFQSFLAAYAEKTGGDRATENGDTPTDGRKSGSPTDDGSGITDIPLD